MNILRKYSKYSLSFCITVCATLLLLNACSSNKNYSTAGLKTKPSYGTYYKIGTPYQINGTWYHPKEQPDYDEVGVASWYGPTFHGKATANGDVFDENALTAAHRTLPLPSMVRVTNIENNRSIILMVNDRGPFSKGRILDVSKRAADILGFRQKGTAKVRVEFLPGQTKQLVANLPGAPKEAKELSSINATDIPKEQKLIENKELLPAPTEEKKIVFTKSNQKQLFSKKIAQNKEEEANNTQIAEESSATKFDAIEKQVLSLPQNAKKYFVQAGTYSMKNNAENVKKELVDLGDVTIQSFSKEKRNLHRVRLGPLDETMKQYVLNKVISLGHPDAIIVYE